MVSECRDIGTHLWDDRARKELLHLFAQQIYHGEAEIRGSRDALLRLAEAATKAASIRQGECVEVQMMASDGECYNLVIRPMSDQQMEDGRLPYAQPGLPWDFE